MAAKRKSPVGGYQINPWVGAQIAAQQNPKPVRIAVNVRGAVTVGFTEADRPVALALLLRYRGPETPRVHRAVLALSEGNLGNLDAMIDAANEDYRDVLYWAEYPEESTTGTQKQKREAARRMEVRWRKMGLKIPTVD